MQKIEGVPTEEFLTKARNAEVEFKEAPGDDDREINKKDTSKRIFSVERFTMARMHHTNDKAILTNPEKLVDFVKSAVLGQLPLYWESEKVPKIKYS